MTTAQLPRSSAARPPRSSTAARAQGDLFTWTPQSASPSEATPHCGYCAQTPDPAVLPRTQSPTPPNVRDAGCGEEAGTPQADPAVWETLAWKGSGTAGGAGGETSHARAFPRLRPYQQSAIDAVRARWVAGDLRTLVVLPTGTGKTVVFAELARLIVETSKRVLVLAHRTELLEQAQRKLADVGLASRLEKASFRAGAAQVVVASVQTLQGKRLEQFLAIGFGMVVVDEGHHAVADSYQRILNHFAGVPILFVTATADRADGKGLEEVCSSVAYQYDLRSAIRDQWLVPIRARRIVVKGVDFSKVKTTAGDLDAKQLGAIMREEEHLHGVVDPLIREAAGRKTIVFAVDVAHAYALAALLNRREPGSALAVDGSSSDEDRKAALAMFASGQIRYLCNCALFTEGFDEPSVQCVAIARPTKSRALYTQMVGRGTRLLGGSYAISVSLGKSNVLVIDFTGNSGKHRLVGPMDALAGNEELAAEVRAEVDKRLAAEEGELEDVLETVEDELEKRRNRTGVIAVAHYRARDIDPFFGEFLEGIDTSGDKTLATIQQREALKGKGIKAPRELSISEANRWLRAIEKRSKAGLASLKQIRVLERHGFDARKWSIRAASEQINKLELAGWQRKDVVA